jgi:hypothetical protein
MRSEESMPRAHSRSPLENSRQPRIAPMARMKALKAKHEGRSSEIGDSPMIRRALISQTTTDYTDNTNGFETGSIRVDPGLIRGKKIRGSGSVAGMPHQPIRGSNALVGLPGESA